MKSRIPLYIFVFLFSVFFLTGCTSTENVKISDGLVEEGLELYEEKYYVKALDKFVEALEVYPANFQAYVGLTDIFVDKGWFEEAEDLAEEASSRLGATESATIYSMVGSGYYGIGAFEDAEEMYKKAFKFDSGYENGRIGLAESNVQLGDVNEARKVLGNKGDSDEFLLLYSYLTLDDWEEGEKKIREIEDSEIRERLEAIYEIENDDVLYKNTSLAGEYINAGYPYLAIELLTKQSSEIEQYPEGQYFLGKAYLDSGDYEGAIEKLNNAIMLDFDNDDVYVNLARAYLFSDNLDRSLETYEVIISSAEFDVVEEYIGVLLENNKKNDAEKTLLSLIDDEETFKLNILLARVYYEKEDMLVMGGLLEKLEAETNLNQKETEVLTRYKILHAIESIDDIAKVDALVERFSVFDNQNPELYLFRGKLFAHGGENTEAKEAFERAIELDLQGDVAVQAQELLASLD